MKDSLTNKWIIAGSVWLAAFILTYGNITKINDIILARQQEEIYQMDELFWKHNSNNISGILKDKVRLFHPTESLKLDLISVEDQVQHLAEKYGFVDFSVVENPKHNEESISVNISYRGSLKGTIQWLDKLKKDFPFMPVQKIVITTSPPEKLVKFQIYLVYRYKIVSS